jgi:ATP-dependent Clp protease ATP-binding subunit ClpA
MAGSKISHMTASPDTIEQLARDATRHVDPDEALRALTALRRELDGLEPGLVARALRAGSSWSRIAASLGVSKQAAHRKHRDVLADDDPQAPADHEAKILVTAEARRCVQLAREEARGLGQQAVGTEHLLLGILRCRRSHAVSALHTLGVTLESARDVLQPTIVEGSEQHVVASPGAPRTFRRRKDITPHAQRILEGALREAIKLRDGYIGVEHLLLALLTDQRNGAVQTLEALHCTPARLRRQLNREWREVAARHEGQRPAPAPPAPPTPPARPVEAAAHR